MNIVLKMSSLQNYSTCFTRNIVSSKKIYIIVKPRFFSLGSEPYKYNYQKLRIIRFLSYYLFLLEFFYKMFEVFKVAYFVYLPSFKVIYLYFYYIQYIQYVCMNVCVYIYYTYLPIWFEKQLLSPSSTMKNSKCISHVHFIIDDRCFIKSF